MIKYAYIKYNTYLITESELKVINTIKSNDTFIIIDRIENCVAVSFQSSYDRTLINSLLSINTDKFNIINIDNKPNGYLDSYIKASLIIQSEIKSEYEDEKLEFESQITVDRLLYDVFKSDFGIDNEGNIIIDLSDSQREQLYESQLLNHVKLYGIDSINNYQKLFLEARLKM